MAFCSNCGHELNDGAKFCVNCGKSTSLVHSESDLQKKTVYDGKLHKCPNCGELLDSFVTICPVCNYELRGTQTTSCVHELSQKLEKAESMDHKVELISNFYIPNTKEDIYEFFILAFSNITAGGYGIDAWTIKLEQAYLKAKLAFGGSEDFKYIQELYDKINKTSTKTKMLQSKNVKGACAAFLGLTMILVGFIGYDISCTVDLYYTSLIFIGILGIPPFLIGLIMLILPERKKKRKY